MFKLKYRLLVNVAFTRICLRRKSKEMALSKNACSSDQFFFTNHKEARMFEVTSIMADLFSGKVCFL